MSALPSAVRKQVAEANRIADEYYKRGTPPADGTPPATDPPATPPAATGTPPAATEPPATPPTAEDFEQKYRVLQGKYNAEVPRLRRQVDTQGAQLQSLQSQLVTTQNLLASLGASRGTTPPADTPPATPPAQPVKLVKDEEIREFGPDLIDVVRRVAREENSSLLPEIDRRVAPVKQRADQAANAASAAATKVAAHDEQNVIGLLDRDVPNWRQQNSDAEFLAWLEERDPYSGRERGELLSQAFQAHDGPRVVNFFLGFQKEHAVVSPPASQTVPPAATPPAQPPVTLDKLVTPGTPKTGAASTQNGNEKRTWTRAEIAQFYRAMAAGQFKSNPDEGKKLEADIFAAQREGRIR